MRCCSQSIWHWRRSGNLHTDTSAGTDKFFLFVFFTQKQTLVVCKWSGHHWWYFSPFYGKIPPYRIYLESFLLRQMCMWECGKIVLVIKTPRGKLVGKTEGWHSAVADTNVMQHGQTQKRNFLLMVYTDRQCLT